MAPLSALANTAASPTHVSAPPPRTAFSPSASATPTIVSITPAAFAMPSRSWPSAAAKSIVSSGSVAKITAARAAGMNRRPKLRSAISTPNCAMPSRAMGTRSRAANLGRGVASAIGSRHSTPMA